MRPHTKLHHLTDEELLRHVDNERDPLTTTDAEIELAGRYAEMMDWRDAHANTVEAIEEYGISADALKALIKRDTEFRNLASDADDVFTRLTALITSAQED